MVGSIGLLRGPWRGSLGSGVRPRGVEMRRINLRRPRHPELFNKALQWELGDGLGK